MTELSSKRRKSIDHPSNEQLLEATRDSSDGESSARQYNKGSKVVAAETAEAEAAPLSPSPPPPPIITDLIDRHEIWMAPEPKNGEALHFNVDHKLFHERI